jgi:RNA polymerase sigma factor (sigma-70 family)
VADRGSSAVARRSRRRGERSDAPDLALIDEVRSGSDGAFAVLYHRYRDDGLHAAKRYLASQHQAMAEDVVEVAFASVYDALRRGHGPQGPFRPYLLVAVRREADRQRRRREREPLVDVLALRQTGREVGAGRSDLEPLEATDHQHGGQGTEPQFDPELLLGEVFSGLNARFRHALWLSEVEGRQPEQMAPLLGLTPNAAAALCYRARRALRAGYFGAYAATLASPTCKPLIAELAAFVEADQPLHGHDAIRCHLEGCAACRDVAKGTIRASGSLAGFAIFGLLSAGYWLSAGRPAEAIATAPRRLRREWAVASLALALVAAMVVVATCSIPDGADDEVGGSRSSIGRADADPVPPADTPSPTPTSSPVPPIGTLDLPPGTDLDLPDPPVSTPLASDPAPPSLEPGVPEATPSLGSLNVLLTSDRDGAGPQAATASAGTPVRVLGPDGRTILSANAGSDGQVRADRLTSGRYRVLATTPVGMVVDGLVRPTVAGSSRREVEVGVVEVVSGEPTVLEVRFVPWRSLSIGGGTATARTAPVGGSVGWTFELASGPLATSDVVAELTFVHPVGTRVALDDDATWGTGRAAGAERPGLVPPSACLAAAHPRHTTILCELSRIGTESAPFSPVIRVTSGEGTLTPMLRLMARHSVVAPAAASGSTVRILG